MAKVNAKYAFVDLNGSVVQTKQSLITEDRDKKNKDGRIKLETAINRLATNSTLYE